jgi:hypothetical protein
MITAARPRTGPRTSDDNIPGQGDEKGPEKLEAQHVAVISCMFFEFEHKQYMPQQIQHFIRAVRETNGIR